MAKYEIIYFAGCPLLDRAKAALQFAGINNYQEVKQDKLPEGHPYKKLSSPSIVKDGKILIGSRNHASECTITDWNKAGAELARKTL
jgi:hypothetical protein